MRELKIVQTMYTCIYYCTYGLPISIRTLSNELKSNQTLILSVLHIKGALGSLERVRNLICRDFHHR